MFDNLPLTLTDIGAARTRIAEHSVHTPLLRHPELDAATGGRVFLKAENLQQTGSFKFRGALNAASLLSPEERAKGLLAWSSGNHGQAVARSARILGCPATVVMPQDAPAPKIEATRRHGAEVVFYDRYQDDREVMGREIAARTGATIIPPYDHLPTIAGQGTVGLEILEDLAALGLTPDVVLVCCGGGGLVAGTALSIRSQVPDAAVLAVEPEGFDDHCRSLAAGERLRNAPGRKSICDSLMAPEPGVLTFPLNQRLLAGGIAVPEDATRAAMRFAFSRLKLVLEPGGAVSLAAVMSGLAEIRGKTVVAVLSGGNVDPALFAAIVTERGPGIAP